MSNKSKSKRLGCSCLKSLIITMCFTTSQTGIAQVTSYIQEDEKSKFLIFNFNYDHSLSPTVFGQNRLNLSKEKQNKSYWLTGAITGFAVGSVATFIVLNRGGSTSLCNQSANQDAIQVHECIGLSLAVGIPFGGLGALIGSFIKVKDSTKVSIIQIPNPDQLSSKPGYGFYFLQAF